MQKPTASELRTVAGELKETARTLGFSACGISRAAFLEQEAYRLDEWLRLGYHASMAWMENHFEKRVDPTRLVEGARSVVSVLDSYWHPETGPQPDGTARVSRYALGDDYHVVMKERMGVLFDWLDNRVGGIGGRIFVDSAPVMDKVWAMQSGLGWIGKNTNLIESRSGSWFFIGELIVDLELPPDAPATDHCGSCTRCLDACPTDALVAPAVLDANRCISYLTIENREPTISPDLAEHLDGWIFGCDVCQEVCPWNKFSRAATEPRYHPNEGIVGKSFSSWEELSIEDFRERFRRSPIKRAKYEGLLRNVAAARRSVTDDSRS